MNSRGKRLLIVDARRFWWRCDFHEPAEKFSVGYAERGTTWKPDQLIIRPEDGPHQLLTVTWPACRGQIIKPSLVRACIDEAVRRGWLEELRELTFAGSDLPDHT